MLAELIILIPAAYLLGSVPWGPILTRCFSDIDIRQEGSKNIGAFNVYRLAGRRLGMGTLIADLSKGAIPVMAAKYLLDGGGTQQELALSLVAVAAFMGHLYPLFLNFNGGKGVATAAGCVLIISPLTFLVCLSVYVLLVSIWGHSSLGSLTSATVMPVVLWMALHSVPITAGAVMMTAFIFIRHVGNIKRLLAGEEDSVFDMH